MKLTIIQPAYLGKFETAKLVCKKDAAKNAAGNSLAFKYGPFGYVLGSRLDQTQKAMMVTKATADRKFAASLS